MKCKKYGHENWIDCNGHINKGYGCPSCNIWTIERVQNESNKKYNNKFIIYDIKSKQDKMNIIKERPYIDIECKICNYRNWVPVDNHIHNNSGCGGKCKHNVNKQIQISNLKNQPILANEKYNLYLLKFTHKETGEQFYKKGKTNRSIKERFSGKQYNNYIIEEIEIIKGTHLWVAQKEDEFINKYYNEYGYTPNEKFGGYTECFRLDIINELNVVEK